MASAEIDLVPRETTEEIVRRDWASTDRSVNHDLEACHTRGSRGFSGPHAIPIRTDRTWTCSLWLRVQQRFSPRELTSREEEGGENRNSRCFSRTTIRLKICYEFLFRPRLQTRIDSTPDCLWNAAADSSKVRGCPFSRQSTAMELASDAAAIDFQATDRLGNF